MVKKCQKLNKTLKRPEDITIDMEELSMHVLTQQYPSRRMVKNVSNYDVVI